MDSDNDSDAEQESEESVPMWKFPNYHRYEQCDGCGCNPILGFRFMCKASEEHEVSLCGDCEAAGKHGFANHEMIRIAPPNIEQKWKDAIRNGDLDSIKAWIKKDPTILRWEMRNFDILLRDPSSGCAISRACILTASDLGEIHSTLVE